MTRLDPTAAALDVKRTATLLRDARAVLRRIDVLTATALAVDDPALPAIAELRSSAERLVAQSRANTSTITSVTVGFRNITVDCSRPIDLARWWREAIGWEEDPENPNLPEDEEAALVAQTDR